jgi:hypothetical protein
MRGSARIDMTGLRYGRLVGIDYSHNHRGHAYWRFLCDCGAETVVSGSAVRVGNTSSCGCLHREICAERLTKHGRRSQKRHDPTYRAWQEINNFCTDRGSARFRDFGALGVRVCAAWRSDFEAFLADMGERPTDTKLARIDTEADFGPGNCRWVALASRSSRAAEGWRRQNDLMPAE